MNTVPSPTVDHSPTDRSLGEGGPAASGVVVDLSSVTDVSEFMSWIGTCPRPSGIRVYLPSVVHRASMQRLQRSLQSMGCTVTLRLAQGKLLRVSSLLRT